MARKQDFSTCPSKQPTYRAWQSMMNRCYTPTNKDFKYLGAKGVRVCARWHDYNNFAADMGAKPADAQLARTGRGEDFTPETTYWLPRVDARNNRTYQIWKGMRHRAGVIGVGVAAKHKSYERRGIDICPEWAESYKAFYEHVGDAPSAAHSIDRIDNDRGYWPGNVRWATKKEQANNRSDNVVISMNGETKTLQEWCDHFGADRATVSSRWFALFAPAHKKNAPCVQMNMEGVEVARYGNAKTAAAATGLKYGTLSKCLSGGNDTAGGYKWRYA